MVEPAPTQIGAGEWVLPRDQLIESEAVISDGDHDQARRQDQTKLLGSKGGHADSPILQESINEFHLPEPFRASIQEYSEKSWTSRLRNQQRGKTSKE